MPTQYSIFHQNMRVFGGGSALRNVGYDDAMSEISSDLGVNQRILVAGFTEINNCNSTAAPLEDFALTLDPGLTKVYHFAIGVTALNKTKTPEYIAIALYKEVSLNSWGRVLRNSDKTWKIYHQDNTLLMPNGDWAADSRGLAYVAITFKGTKMIIGFIHNMYNLGDRSGAFTAIPKMADEIRKTEGGAWTQAPIYIGGDFNVAPRTFSSRANMSAVYAEDAHNNPENTTSSNAYDFWLYKADPTAVVHVDNNDAQVHTETRDVPNGLSDHAGISLKLPYW